MKVAILGASDKADRYSFKALKSLLNHGHRVFPIHPRLKNIEGQKVYGSLQDIREKIDTLTLYVNAQRSSELMTEILKMNPGRIIFNPGAENPGLKNEAEKAGIQTEESCTLVMLSTNQF